MTQRRIYMPPGFSRRTFLKRSGAAAAGLTAASMLPAWARVLGQDAAAMRALVPAAPDPTPPGVPNAAYSAATNDAFAAWQAANSVKVEYEDVPWPQLHDKMAANFASGVHTHDVVYMSGWVPEFADFLVPFVDDLPAELLADLPIEGDVRIVGGELVLEVEVDGQTGDPARKAGGARDREREHGDGVTDHERCHAPQSLAQTGTRVGRGPRTHRGHRGLPLTRTKRTRGRGGASRRLTRRAPSSASASPITAIAPTAAGLTTTDSSGTAPPFSTAVGRLTNIAPSLSASTLRMRPAGNKRTAGSFFGVRRHRYVRTGSSAAPAACGGQPFAACCGA